MQCQPFPLNSAHSAHSARSFPVEIPMVQFNRSRSPRVSPPTTSVTQLIYAALASQDEYLQELQLEIDVNVDPAIATVICDASLAQIVRDLLRDAIVRSPSQCELSISACRTHRGIEIEIADSTSDDEGVPYNAFSRCPPQTLGGLSSRLGSGAVREGWELYRTRCPQGGQAWTVVLSSRQKRVRAA